MKKIIASLFILITICSFNLNAQDLKIMSLPVDVAQKRIQAITKIKSLLTIGYVAENKVKPELELLTSDSLEALYKLRIGQQTFEQDVLNIMDAVGKLPNAEKTLELINEVNGVYKIFYPRAIFEMACPPSCPFCCG